jgi:hypothetical protein
VGELLLYYIWRSLLLPSRSEADISVLILVSPFFGMKARVAKVRPVPHPILEHVGRLLEGRLRVVVLPAVIFELHRTEANGAL